MFEKAVGQKDKGDKDQCAQGVDPVSMGAWYIAETQENQCPEGIPDIAAGDPLVRVVDGTVGAE